MTGGLASKRPFPCQKLFKNKPISYIGPDKLYPLLLAGNFDSQIRHQRPYQTLAITRLVTILTQNE